MGKGNRKKLSMVTPDSCKTINDPQVSESINKTVSRAEGDAFHSLPFGWEHSCVPGGPADVSTLFCGLNQLCNTNRQGWSRRASKILLKIEFSKPQKNSLGDNEPFRTGSVEGMMMCFSCLLIAFSFSLLFFPVLFWK